MKMIFYMFLSFLAMLNSMVFSFMNHPLAMGLILMFQTVLICLISGMMMKTFWFSYILFIVFLGGMLVLFIYVTSLASNEMFNFSFKIFSLMFFTLLISLLILLFIDKTMMMIYFKNLDLNFLNNQMNFQLENNMMLNKLYNFSTNLITIVLMLYLFLTLIAIVKITDIFEGPLRPKFKF